MSSSRLTHAQALVAGILATGAKPMPAAHVEARYLRLVPNPPLRSSLGAILAILDRLQGYGIAERVEGLWGITAAGARAIHASKPSSTTHEAERLW